MSISDYQDPKYGMVSNRPHPIPYSWDNPALFTAQYYNLVPHNSQNFSENFVIEAMKSWSRWPGGPGGPPSQDEIIGWAMLCPGLTQKILKKVPLKQYRFIDLIPFLKMRAWFHVYLPGQLLWALATIATTWTSRKHTTWKMQKWVTLRTVLRADYRICNWAIRYWQRKMTEMYPGGARELFSIYFPENPVLVAMAPDNFDLT